MRSKAMSTCAIALAVILPLGCTDDLFKQLQVDVDRYVNNLVTLTIVTVDQGTTSPADSVDIPASKAYAITATPYSGYRFSGWEIVSGTPSIQDSTAESTTITLTDGDATIRPRFDVWAAGGVTFDPAPDTYQTAQSVTMTPVTDGATIRYTLDGTIPTESTGIEYSDPVVFPLDSGPTTLTAVAFKTGMAPSEASIGVYRITGTVAAPTFSSTPTTSPNTSFSVTIACATDGATIRYTTDDSDPSSSAGAVYSGAIPVTTTTTIRAIAYKTDWTDSTIASTTYTIAWAKSYGTTTADVAYNLVPFDGAWYIAGKSLTSTRRLAKIGLDGTLAWTSTYTQNMMSPRIWT